MGKIFVLHPDGIERLLSTCLVGRIAYSSPNVDGGRPFIVPLAFAYDGEAVYAVGPVGRKIHVMREQPLVSFEVDTAEAEDRWESVVAEGVYEELSEPDAREQGLSIIFRDNPRPEIPDTHVVYRIRLTHKTGRFEVPDEEAAAYETAY